MAHNDLTKIISSIKLPGSNDVYEIHDAHAIHSAEELGIASALVFMGTKATDEEILALTDAKKGEVWLATGTNTEYVCIETISSAAKASAWEKLGNVHDAASSNHTHTVTVEGANEASAVTGTVIVPTVSKTQKYMTARADAPEVTKTTKTISATASGTVVGADGTAKAITGFGTHTTDAALGADATFEVTGGDATTSKMVTSTASKVSVTNKNIPNVTANTEVTASKAISAGSKTDGTAASWSASVTNGVLSFDWVANTPTVVTLPTFSDVTATNTALGAEISVSAVTASDVTVATGALAQDGAGSAVATGVNAISVAVKDADPVSAITALGTPTTADALTGVKVTVQPTITVSNGESVVTDVEVAPSAITLVNNATNVTGAIAVSDVTVGETSVNLQNGQAAAQKWTQSTGSTHAPQ